MFVAAVARNPIPAEYRKYVVPDVRKIRLDEASQM